MNYLYAVIILAAAMLFVWALMKAAKNRDEWGERAERELRERRP